MNSEKNTISIGYTPRFKKNVKLLKKKYRNIRKDIDGMVKELKKGKVIGDKLAKCNYPLFKARVKNSDMNRGKSAGYRCIYYLKTPTVIILVTIYSKSEQGDIANRKLYAILKEYF